MEKQSLIDTVGRLPAREGGRSKTTHQKMATRAHTKYVIKTQKLLIHLVPPTNCTTTTTNQGLKNQMADGLACPGR